MTNIESFNFIHDEEKLAEDKIVTCIVEPLVNDYLEDVMIDEELYVDDTFFFDPSKPPIFDEEFQDMVEKRVKTTPKEPNSIVNFIIEKDNDFKELSIPSLTKFFFERKIHKMLKTKSKV